MGVGSASSAMRRALPLTPAIPARSKCWGWNANGQLGLGDTLARGYRAGEMGANLPSVDLGAEWTVVEVAVGAWHTCTRLENGAARALKCWGRNYDGQLGLGNTDHRGDVEGDMGDSLPAVQLGTNRSAVALALGGAHSCALLDDASVKCWGLNGESQLFGPGLNGDSQGCFFFNGHGQLGLGDTDSRGDAGGGMGDILPSVSLCRGACPAGYTAGSTGAAGWACVACEAGTYKATVGSDSCAACPSPTSSVVGGDELADCSACAPGFTMASDGVTCNACEAGTYKATAGPGSCEACPANSTSAAGSGDCSCDAGHSGGVQAIQCGGSCKCSPSLAPGGVISGGCSRGYSSFWGCWSGSDKYCWWIISGANPSVTITSWSTPGTSGTNIYDRVYVDESGDAGFSSGVVRLATVSSDAVRSGTSPYQTYAATAPHLRLRFTSRTPTSDYDGGGFMASWISGFSGVCSACLAGQYKATAGLGSCAACPWGTFSSEGSKELIDCKCVAGWTAASDGVECEVCQPGTFKSAVGSGACSACEVGTYEDRGGRQGPARRALHTRTPLRAAERARARRGRSRTLSDDYRARCALPIRSPHQTERCASARRVSRARTGGTRRPGRRAARARLGRSKAWWEQLRARRALQTRTPLRVVRCASARRGRSGNCWDH